jgi:predicted ATPase/DNA-binding winged helix-turn-helix (wHTH) protein
VPPARADMARGVTKPSCKLRRLCSICRNHDVAGLGLNHLENIKWLAVRVSPEDIRSVYASGACEIDLGRRELRVLGSRVPVGSRAFEIIEVLARSAGELVTKDELLDRIWPGAIVTENTLRVHAGAIRKALGPYRNLLKTESGRGFRLLGDWTVQHHDAARPPAGLQRMWVGESPVTNIPATVTPLIGRSVAAARLRDFISAYRLVTLTGPGGIGKTSLALKVTGDIVGEFADGGWLIELASLSDSAQVTVTVANVLRLELGSHPIVPESLARTIADKRLLLILDNCEHLIGAVAPLAETLLAICPHITIVTTSREILRVQGEHVWPVPPLEVPAAEWTEPAEIPGHTAAEELFLARAGALGADFTSDTRYPAMIAAICRHLDGIPLAIEFAAARASTLGIEQVASGLHDRFALLTNGRRTALPRHQTLRAALDWSYQLLSEGERELLRRIAIFAGPFSLDAARAVAAEGTTDAEFAERIANLVGKSLVGRTADGFTAEFRLLETTRVYAIDRLTESGALNPVARRHAAYFLEVLENIGNERRSKPQDEYLAATRRRSNEVHIALEWAFSAAGDPAVGVALTIAAVPLWFELFHMLIARARVEQALLHAETGSEDEMRLRIAFGQILWYLTPKSDAIEPAFGRALNIAERIGAIAVRAQALWGMWAARRGRGDYSAALEAAHRYADAAKNAGDASAIHLGDRILGLTHHVLGHQLIAREFANRALRQPHYFDPTSGIGFQVETPIAIGLLLARILWLLGFADQAIEAAAEAMAEARKIGHPYAISYAVSFAGLPVALWTGALEETPSMVDLLITNAIGYQLHGQWGRSYARALRLRSGNESEVLIASFIEARAGISAIPPFEDLPSDEDIPVPLPGAEPVDELWNAPEMLRVDAELLLWHDGPGAVPAAEAKLLRALEIARGQSALSWELRVAMSLMRLSRRHGRATAALRLLAATYGKFTEGFETSDLIHARSLMEGSRSMP